MPEATEKNSKSKISQILLSLGLSIGTGIVAWLFSLNSKQVYGALKKPAFAPPSWIFGPVWAVLYVLMGIALYFVIKDGIKEPKIKNAFIYFCIQLVFNVLWSVLFFTLQLRAAALVDIIILLIYIAVTTYKFFRIDKKAGYLMLPYLAWVLFASILNLSIVMLNG